MAVRTAACQLTSNPILKLTERNFYGKQILCFLNLSPYEENQPLARSCTGERSERRDLNDELERVEEREKDADESEKADERRKGREVG